MSDKLKEIVTECEQAALAVRPDPENWLNTPEVVAAAARLILAAREERDLTQFALAAVSEELGRCETQREDAYAELEVVAADAQFQHDELQKALARVTELEAARDAAVAGQTRAEVELSHKHKDGMEKMRFYEEANGKLGKLVYEQKDRIAELEKQGEENARLRKAFDDQLANRDPRPCNYCNEPGWTLDRLESLATLAGKEGEGK